MWSTSKKDHPPESLPADVFIDAGCKTEYSRPLSLFNKLEFGGRWPLPMRARCSAFRYCPNPLGIVPAEQFDKLEFDNIKAA